MSPRALRTCHTALIGVGWWNLAHVGTTVVVVTLPSLCHRRVVPQPHPLQDQTLELNDDGRGSCTDCLLLDMSTAMLKPLQALALSKKSWMWQFAVRTL